MSKKPIIVFEGIEGSGKSHHISIVSKYLKRKKISHIKIREPGGSINSEKIRRLILNQKSNFNKNTDLLLYLAARSENIDKIKKNYNKKAKKKLLKVSVNYEGPVEAPINKDQKIATLKVVYDQELIGEYDLLSSKEIKKINFVSRIIKSLNYLIWGDV